MSRPTISWTPADFDRAWTETYPVATGGATVRAVVEYLGAIHPLEAAVARREAEREAFRRGTQRVMCGDWRGLCNGEVDAAYPLLTPPSPPPLVLSTGTWTRARQSIFALLWHRQTGEYVREPERANASDNRLYADWLAQYGTEQERA